MNMYDSALWKHYSVTVFIISSDLAVISALKNSSVSRGWTACLGYSLIYRCPV